MSGILFFRFASCEPLSQDRRNQDGGQNQNIQSANKFAHCQSKKQQNVACIFFRIKLEGRTPKTASDHFSVNIS